MKETLYSIGEVAKLANVSIQTLRYYDQISLFKPAYVDPNTNYRYYKDSQLYHLDLIKSLKYIGTSLEDIKKVQHLQREDSLLFLNEQDAVIEQQLERLKEVQQNIKYVKRRIKKQLNYPVFGEIVIQEEVEMRILKTAVKNISPLDLLNASYSELKKIVEFEEGVINNSYGAIISNQPYEKVEEITYTHIFTPILTDKQISTMSPGIEVAKIPAGRYVCIYYIFTPEVYFTHLQMLMDYIVTHQLKVTGDIYEMFTQSYYTKGDEGEYIVEMKIRLMD
ncbi:MerR family transcriptional regulator [Ferdinandcohnia quinoae]|uniref:MerR family transcriptional regulator n=1 Tax=Fredinandcohnia quinoae TaxID=2918902 RepID=A0AAW5E929_9BACI|nr:MerR family transcriptional regulator [Fredinandcohnia sp. SECRCQ15]MCH1625269.1 MerR family transcriptional regulator [Fredinandcohnia sp. SECRCQ15]